MSNNLNKPVVVHTNDDYVFILRKYKNFLYMNLIPRFLNTLNFSVFDFKNQLVTRISNFKNGKQTVG